VKGLLLSEDRFFVGDHVVVYFLNARIRNSKAVGEVLDSRRLQSSLTSITTNAGHDGLPVYFALCEPGHEADKTAEVVFTLGQQRCVPLKSMAVFLGALGLPPWDNLTQLIMSFYEALRTRYMDDTRGQQQSLIPLPLFALDIQSHSDDDLVNASRMLATWTERLREFFHRFKTSEMKDSDALWEGAVDTLLDEVRVPSYRSPASEKVRSILFYLLMKCRADTASNAREYEKGTGEDRKVCPSDIFENFLTKLGKLLEGGEKAKEQCGGARTDEKSASSPRTSKEVIHAQAIGHLLKKKSFRFVHIVKGDEVQGCEFDVVVVCAFLSIWLPRDHLFYCLSRAKLLSIVIDSGEVKFEWRWEKMHETKFSDHFRDWREFGQTST
jgi:hypothetical protein